MGDAWRLGIVPTRLFGASVFMSTGRADGLIPFTECFPLPGSRWALYACSIMAEMRGSFFLLSGQGTWEVTEKRIASVARSSGSGLGTGA